MLIRFCDNQSLNYLWGDEVKDSRVPELLSTIKLVDQIQRHNQISPIYKVTHTEFLLAEDGCADVVNIYVEEI